MQTQDIHLGSPLSTACFSPALAARQPVAARLLANALSRGHMAHAYLLTGRCIADKWLMARQLAAYLNCEKEDKEKSGSCLLSYTDLNDLGEPQKVVDDKTFSSACQNCRWLFRDEHPKAWVLLSRDAGKSGKIPVESARNLSEELARTSQYLRVVVIDDASEWAFHRPAANALLKTIEEPRSNCLFLLFGECEEDVLRTIVSRCQPIPLNNRFEENIGFLARQSPSLKSRLEASAWSSDENRDLIRKMRGELFLSTPPHKRVAEKDALKFSHHLQEELEEHGGEKLFDLAINIEVENLAGSYRTDAKYSRYLLELFKLGEEAKLQLDHYVTKKGVCETFVLSWLKLRQNLIR
ncbi:MAG: hypothetical protein KGS72_26640 [Cyanobacteria bacterium REEB67]|nr:hypothetical protein [Cyanobacteria bacterium REEB67]